MQTLENTVFSGGVFTEHEGGPAAGVLGVHTLALGYKVGEDIGVAQHGRHVYRLTALLVACVQPRSSGHWKQIRVYFVDDVLIFSLVPRVARVLRAWP